MAKSIIAYREQLKALLPQGEAWPREINTTFNQFLETIAVEFSRVDIRGDNASLEANPLTTGELLTDWERVAGLPDFCVGELPTIQQRRQALTGRLAARGGQSISFFINFGKDLGYDITIQEFRPFQAGKSRAQDRVHNIHWRFAWQVKAPETTLTHFRAGHSAALEPLRAWGNKLLECMFNRVKPAHTKLIFAYHSEE